MYKNQYQTTAPRSFPSRFVQYALVNLSQHIGDKKNDPPSPLSIPSYDFVVLNSAEAAAELLDKRSGLYSDRLFG
ncbi:hypothetical protein B0J17DRAFT_13883 [Rhizoctonia solani]|nr:hypothetical protein B0J17DRAFT_13883 [Rhizoctonia solani]